MEIEHSNIRAAEGEVNSCPVILPGGVRALLKKPDLWNKEGCLNRHWGV